MADQIGVLVMTDEEALATLRQMQAERTNWERQNMSLRKIELLVDTAKNAKARLDGMKNEITATEKAKAQLDIDFNNTKTQLRKQTEEARKKTEAEIAEVTKKAVNVSDAAIKMENDFKKREAELNDRMKDLVKKVEEKEMALAKASAALDNFKREHKL